MKVLHERCAGMDVHKDTVVVCVLVGAAGVEVHREVRTFGTTTRHLLGLSDWLHESGVSHAAMESTGVYWKPVFNVLEGLVDVWRVNARHVKTVPGRKTDVKDCEWLADLMRHGLLKRSMIPPPETRELRDLTRYRRTVIQEKSREANRVQKILEDANIKLGSVATDVLGVSGRVMLRAIVEGAADGGALAELARGRLRSKKAELAEALTGRIRPHHRLLMREILDHVEYLEQAIARIDREIEERLQPFSEAMCRLDEVPGLDARTIQDILAEIGTDMARFPSAHHLASWAGICPGNNESAGKRRSGRIRKGSRWLRSALVQAAWAASRKKKSYFNALYFRIKGRRGANKALVAVAHSLLCVIYHMMQRGTTYRELGSQHFDNLHREKVAHRIVKRLKDLGYEVSIRATG